jgi:hypothetical protein
VRGATGAAKVSALRKFVAPWFALPADITGDGQSGSKASSATPARD